MEDITYYKIISFTPYSYTHINILHLLHTVYHILLWSGCMLRGLIDGA
jgi:hypothetical protein